MPTAWRKQTEPHQQTLPVRVLGSHLFTIAQYADEAECSCKRYLTENITRTKRILYSHLRHKEIRYKEATFPSLSSCIPINVQWEALWRMRENLTWIRMQRIFLLTSLHPPVATYCYAIVAYSTQHKKLSTFQLTFWRQKYIYIFLILAHPVCKMWIIQEQNVTIMKQTAFWRGKNGDYIPCLKYSVHIIIE